MMLMMVACFKSQTKVDKVYKFEEAVALGK